MLLSATQRLSCGMTTCSLDRKPLLAILLIGLITWQMPAMAQQNTTDSTRETSSPLRWGGYAHLLLADHNASFARLPGVPNCCAEFTGGGGFGWEIGAIAGYSITRQIAVEGRLGYLRYGGALREREETTVIFEGVPRAGSFEHQLDADFSGLLFAPSLIWRPTSTPLYLQGGPVIGLLLDGTYEQQEVLIEPETFGLFENNRRIRNESSGSIPDRTSLFAAIELGAGWELPLNEAGTLTISPEVGYTIGLTNHVMDSSWSVNFLSLGAALRFGTRPAEPDTQPVPPPVLDTIVAVDTVEIPRISATIEAVGLDEEGRVTDLPTLKVEEFISTNLRPLLTYVFFEENSHTIPERYVKIPPGQEGRFAIDRLHSVPVLPTYHHVLNIIGRRMVDNPDEVVELVGTNDGLGERVLDGTELSERRARAVREYLMRTWGIDSSRLPISTRDLPDRPSNVRIEDGIEENRRVELRSDAWEIVQPIVTIDTLRVTNPPSIRIDLETDATGPLRSWRVEVRQEGRVIRAFSSDETLRERGGNPVEELPREILWNLAEDQLHVPRSDMPVTFELTVVDGDGRVARSMPDTIEVEQITVSEKRRERIADRYIDRYRLILFEFDSANLGPLNQRIAEYIRRRVQPESEVSVIGQTDRIGATAHNLRLSQGRAESTVEALDLPSELGRGEGENTELYNNDLPEGRFYSRTVRVLVETPVQADSTAPRE